MTKRVWIFGDSYADPNWQKERHVFETWYEKLAKQYEYNNFAVSGTGPHYSMKQFYKLYKQFNEEDLVVWILSGEERIQFHLPNKYRTAGLKSERDEDVISPLADIGAVHEPYYDIKDQELIIRDISFSLDHKKFYEEYRDHMAYAGKTFEEEISNSNKKNEAFLYAISRIQKCKICVFFLRPNDSYIKNSLNDDLFVIPNIPGLSQVAEEEYKEPGIPYYEDNTRTNHLSEANHKVMYNIIDNFVQGIRWMPEFKQNLLEKPERPTERFIYD